jgi:UDP:flavonoid glycosyltransferase YjiC (YdhE family)
MAKIVISSTGTHGDHLPYIALGVALKERGHRVYLAFRASMHEFVINAGLEAIAFGEELSEVVARQNAADWDQFQPKHYSLTTQIERIHHYLAEDLPISFQKLSLDCQDADLFIAGFQRHLFGAMLANKIGLPWVAASVTPSFQCSKPTQKNHHDQNLFNNFLPTLQETFKKLSIPELDWLNYEKNERAILASSAHFSQPHPDYNYYQQTGFWFYEDPSWTTWQPKPDLVQFLQDYPQPLFLTFSSIPVVDPKTVLAVHCQTAQALGKGLIVQRGWANFNESFIPDNVEPRSIFFVDFMPQDWLLSQVAAIIHHGGVGTIARALRNNCPMLVEPLGNDQFFNAKQILNLKVGTAAHPHKITPDGLANILKYKVLTPEVRDHVKLLGTKIRAENSLDQACHLIESWLPAA